MVPRAVYPPPKATEPKIIDSKANEQLTPTEISKLYSFTFSILILLRGQKTIKIKVFCSSCLEFWSKFNLFYEALVAFDVSLTEPKMISECVIFSCSC